MTYRGSRMHVLDWTDIDCRDSSCRPNAPLKRYLAW